MYELLTFVGFIMLAVFVPAGLAIGCVVSIVTRQRSKYYKEVAYACDKFGNVVCQDLFNLTLIKKDGYKFGEITFTVSDILAMNKDRNTLTIIGKIICFVLIKLKDSSFKK